MVVVQFALMADIYAKKVKGIKEPKIALLSNGAEDEKGNELILKVHPILRQIEGINFVGNIESVLFVRYGYKVIIGVGCALIDIVDGVFKIFSGSTGKFIRHLFYNHLFDGVAFIFDMQIAHYFRLG